MKNKSTSIIIGIILVIVGIGYVGNVFDVWNFKLFFPGWWTLFIIVPAVVMIARRGPKPVYVICLGAGALLLISKLGIIPVKLTELIVPALILAIGFTIIFRGQLNSKYTSGKGSSDSEKEPLNPDSYIAFFTGRTPNYNGKRFDGAFATAIFGGVDLKLQQAEITDGVSIDALAVFGGIDVIFAPEVNVEISCIPIFGGISEPKHRVHNDSYPTVYINAFCLFGGVDVK